MARLRRLALGLGALVTATLAIAVPGAVADQMPLNGMVTLTSTHFQIHFDGDYRNPDYLASARANDVLGFAERSYATYTGLGYAAPVDDGDGNGLIEIYIDKFSAEPQVHYAGYIEALATPGAGAIHMDVTNGILLDPTDSTKGIDAHAVAHEVFNLFEWKIDATADPWLQESAAEWAAFQVANTVLPTASQLGEADRSIDCIGSQCGYAQGSIAGYSAFYDRNANTGWSFFQYLSDLYGKDVVRQIWLRDFADGAVPATQPVDEVLTSKGSSLSTAFSGWAKTRLNAGFSITPAPSNCAGSSSGCAFKPLMFATISTGATAGTIPTQVLAVGHLSARYLELKPGDGSANGSCFGATLKLNVAIPAGVTSAPTVFVTSDSAPQSLSVSGSNATITLPWSSCSSSPSAYLALPNATLNPAVNGNEFVVTGSLTVDPNSLPTVGGNAGPPPPVKMPGTVISVPTVDSPPSIDVFGPELIHLAAGSSQLRLIVASDGPGKLNASLGGVTLGQGTLRAGHNDLRFALPATALSALRRTAATAGTLTLTPLSPLGTSGTPVVRQVAVDPAPAAEPNAAPKAKPVAKPKAKAKPKKRTAGKR
jgi:hypothetical protein